MPPTFSINNARAATGGGASEATRTSGRVLIVSNRLPVKIHRDGDAVRLTRSVGGLASGLRPIHERGDSLWIGSAGELRLDAADAAVVDRELRAQRCSPVHVSHAERITFYEKISNGILWPLMHDRLDRLPLRLDGWETYESVNAKFADVVAEHWRPGDLVWVHDYHLMRVPALLRQRLPQAAIGFFMHIPFPNPEIFLTLPVRRWLIEGMLGADVIGFHTRRYRGHFTAAVRRLLGLEMDADEHLRYAERAVHLGIFPIGVAATELQQQASTREISQKVLEHRTRHERLLLGVDRLDYSKGIPRRLVAFERLLETHPEWHGHVRLVQVAVPSRGGVTAYRKFRQELEMLVTRINGRFATPSWTPINYLYRSLQLDELLALYRSADVMLVTPVRDGMNLVAKEFVAARTDEEGVLILSEFAGAADKMGEALVVNPYDIDGVAAAMHHALVMPGVERRHRMRALRAHVLEHNVDVWAQDFLDALQPASRSTR